MTAPAPARAATRRRAAAPWPALLVLAAVGLAALLPELLAPHDPFAQNVTERLTGPTATHPFGTDELGRDLLSRVVHGTRATLATALLALAFAFGLGLLIGLAAGYLGGLVDRVLMAGVDVLLALPSLLISLLIVSGLGTGPGNLAVAVGIASVPALARVTRAEVLRVSSQPFVEAAAGFGVARHRVLLRHVLPHARGPISALAALELATMVLSVSALSFLGYGTQPPDPEWGTLIAGGRDYFATAWWLTTLPGAVLACAVLALHRLGRSVGAGHEGLTP
ncbi:ABC transporter permease subunit [Streptomyces sp. 3MP-14]|uniref:ABC transporter permease subunit n=1 Tax=Streptomyces mimosae TaxID=2586635 RepID=A0A5N6A581_9ACTN|nr:MULTISPECIES: ABC transporter permease [Streptomyces]KAB8162870.1 ABC transporter permease subunit [Streptomyces mimosae]KAB8179083.1 ABC transporter permease subunit [Streptomyces sp. 3MP-14]